MDKIRTTSSSTVIGRAAYSAAFKENREQDQPPHPLRALFTAWMSSATSNAAPLGTPYGQAEDRALRRAMLSSVTSSSTVTCPLPLQSPMHAPILGV
jgi:hypothetical protein